MNGFGNKKKNDRGRKPGGGPQFYPGCGTRSIFIWLILIPIIALLLWNIFTRATGAPEISYTKFRQQLEKNNIQQITVEGSKITGTFKSSVQVQTSPGHTAARKEFTTYLPPFEDQDLYKLLKSQGVEIVTRPESEFSFGTLLINLLPLLLLVWLGFMFFNRMRSQGQNIFSMGKSRAKLYSSKEKTTFDDVAGSKGTKTELKEIIEFLKYPERFHRLGGKIPKGLLLVGPPGSGKTLIARAVAGEANAPFFSITGSDFMEMFVGVGASRVRDLFEKAKKQSPSIIFIDELDSIGRRRGAGLGGGHDEREQTLNQLLSEMDGFEPNENVIVVAATNRPDILDPALLRPGRFDRRVTIDLPSMKDRIEIIKIHTRDKPMSKKIDLEKVARSTPGFSGADIANMLNEAALFAARKEKKKIGQKDIEEARDKIMMGLERENLVLSKEDCRLIAYHESGHAVVASIVPNADPVHKVTIVPRGHAMGATQQLPEGEKYIYPREYIIDRLTVMLGGRASEKMVLNTITSGAENDLKEATRIARKMVLEWGMSEKLGQVAMGGRRNHVFLGEEIAERREYSEYTAREVDKEIKQIIDESYNRAMEILKNNRDSLKKVAETLLEKEEMTGEEVKQLLGVKEKGKQKTENKKEKSKRTKNKKPEQGEKQKVAEDGSG